MSNLEQEIREALHAVEDPALGRTLHAGGQIGDVTVDETDRRAVIEVFVVSPGYPLQAELDEAINVAVADLKLADLRIEHTLRVPQKPARQDLNRLPTVKNVIAIAAGKGGVGKSTVAVNVAMGLQRLGASAGLLDADIYGPSVPKMLGTPDRDTAAASEGAGIIPALYRGLPVMSVEFFVEPGKAVIWRGPMIHKLLTQFLEDVIWGDLDYLVVDLPPGTGDAQLSLAQLIPITGAVMVTTPQEVALLDVRKAVNMFDKLEVPVLGVVENMSYYRCDACGNREAIFGSGGGKRLAEEIGADLLGQIPIDPRVAHGGESGVPVVESAPDSELSKALLDVAARGALEASKLSARGPKRSSLLRTV